MHARVMSKTGIEEFLMLIKILKVQTFLTVSKLLCAMLNFMLGRAQETYSALALTAT
jgi:hypothetical protein